MSDAWLEVVPPLTFTLLGAAGALGLLALISPSRFALVAQSGGHWVDTSKLSQLLDRPIEVDRHVLRYSRCFGAAVVVSAAWLAYVCMYWL